MRVLWIVFAVSTLLFAHNLQHNISYDKGVTIALKFEKEGDFSFKAYEVYAPNQTVAFQVGRTDLYGRITFLPDTQGVWKVKFFSQDGHGKIILVDVNGSVKQVEKIQNAENNAYRILGGLFLLFGIFGLIYFIARRKK